MWEQALKAEFDGLDKLGVFEHDLTLTTSFDRLTLIVLEVPTDRTLQY